MNGHGLCLAQMLAIRYVFVLFISYTVGKVLICDDRELRNFMETYGIDKVTKEY